MASRSPNTERSSWLTHEEYVAALREQAARFGTVLAAGPADAPVPTCPGWTALDLVQHVAQVYDHKTAVLRAAGEAVPGGKSAPAGESLPQALRRHDAVLADLADLLTELDPQAPAWTWMEGAGESTVGAWARRMVHEAFIHRVDAELTAGVATSPVEEAVAIDGVNEMLTWMAGDPDLVAEDESAGSGTVVLEYGSGAWLVDVGDGRHLVTATDTGTPADAQLAASAAALDLLMWGRPSPASWPGGAAVDRLQARIAKAVD